MVTTGVGSFTDWGRRKQGTLNLERTPGSNKKTSISQDPSDRHPEQVVEGGKSKV